MTNNYEIARAKMFEQIGAAGAAAIRTNAEAKAIFDCGVRALADALDHEVPALQDQAIRDAENGIFAFRDPGGQLTFLLAPGEEVRPGDLITVDRGTGKVRKWVAGKDDALRSFTVPPGSRVTEDGFLEMPR